MPLRIHVDAEHASAALQAQVRRQIRDQGGLAAATLFIDERYPPRHD
jgi:hypothetical protein